MRTELDDLYDDVAAYLAPHWAAGSIKVTPKVQGAIDFLKAYLTKRNGTHPVPISSGRQRLRVSRKEC